MKLLKIKVILNQDHNNLLEFYSCYFLMSKNIK